MRRAGRAARRLTAWSKGRNRSGERNCPGADEECWTERNGTERKTDVAELILEIYDEMTEAMKTGKPYQTGFGPTARAEGNFLLLPRWRPVSRSRQTGRRTSLAEGGGR